MKSISFGFYACKKSLCNCCHKTLPSTFVYDNNFQQFRILYFINCLSKNVIFSIYCNICGPISIRFSSSSINDTFVNLRKIILFDVQNPLSIHFHQANHSFDNFFIQGIDLVYNINNVSSKLYKWIQKLRTFIYPGLDLFVFKFYSPRLTLRYSPENCILFKKIQKLLFKRFNVNVLPTFSSNSNLRQMLCKTKL